MLGLLDVKYDSMISLFLEDIPVIPDLEDVQEEDMMTQIAAPPRCVIDMFHLEPFPISGVLCEKIPLKHQLMPSRRSCPHLRRRNLKTETSAFCPHCAVGF